MRIKLILCLAVLWASTPCAYATQVQEIVTPGGITAWLVEEHSLPLITVKFVFVEAGHAHDAAGKEGTSWMMTDMLLQGAGSMDAQAFQRALEEKAIRLSMQVDEDIFATELETLSENKERAFELLGLALTQPRFDEEAMKRIRAQALAQLKTLEANPQYMLERAWTKAAFGTHPYGKMKTGTAESIGAISVADLKDQAQRYYAKDNLRVAIVGDMDAKTAGALLDKYLAGLPAKANPRTSVAEVALLSPGKYEELQKDIPQTLVGFGVNAPKRESPEYYALYVLNYILGGGDLTSRLNAEIREKRGLAYYAYSRPDPMLHASVLQGFFATRNNEVASSIKVMNDTLARLHDKGITAKELKEAKQYINGSFPLQMDSNSALADYLISMQVYHLGRDYLEKRRGYFDAVTLPQVNTLAKKLLDPKGVTVIVVGNPSSGG